MKRALALLIALLAPLVVMTAPVFDDDAQAQTSIFVDSTTALNSDAIVNGTVISTTSVEVNGVPHRVSEISVGSTLQGEVNGTIIVEVPGGEMANGGYYFVSHTPDFVEGDEVQIALTGADALLAATLPIATGVDSPVFSVVGGTQGAARLSPTTGVASAIGDYQLTGSSWPGFGSGVEFMVNASDVKGMSATAANLAIRAGYQIWEDDPGSNVDFTYGGTTNVSGVNLNDNQNSVSFVTPPAGSNWLAQAHWISNGRGDILQFDVIIDRNRPWSVGATPSHFDIQTTVAHEVGHGLGLGHAGASEELMYASVSSGRTKGLGDGDRSGLFALYPAPAGDPLCSGETITVNLQTGQGSPTSGRDVILGTSGNDTIHALGGDDVICSGGGDDRVFGGSGDDIIEGGDGVDRLFGGAGNDRILGGGGNDIIHGNRGNDTLFGEAGNDKIYGYADRDVIWGGNGNDILHGNFGNDEIHGGPGNDRVWGYGDNDVLYGDDGDDLVVGNPGDDIVNGGSGNDLLKGQAGNDTLSGGAGSDELQGHSGTDVLSGGAGQDTVDGGVDADICSGESASRCES